VVGGVVGATVGTAVGLDLHEEHFAFSLAQPDGAMLHQFAMMLSQLACDMSQPLD
jgi:hypothetical protein